MVRFDVYLVALDPAVGREIQKTRPAVIVSPDALNRQLGTVTVVPMTTKARTSPFRVPCAFKGKTGLLVTDHLRSVDKARLVKRLGPLDASTGKRLLGVLREMFTE